MGASWLRRSHKNALREGLMALDYGGSCVVGILASILGEMRNRWMDSSRDVTRSVSRTLPVKNALLYSDKK